MEFATARIATTEVAIPHMEPRTTLLCARTLRLFTYLLVSILMPMIALLHYLNYAAANGIILETGCEGPAIPFSMTSGIVFALLLRLEARPNNNCLGEA